MQTAHDCGEGDTTSTLDVVIEARHIRAVLVQESLCIPQAKVLAIFG